MKRLSFFLLPVFLIWHLAFAQTAGNIDLALAKPAGQSGDSSRFNGRVLAVVRQPDGKLIAAGDFSRYNGLLARSFVRLLPDGNIDKSFGVAAGFDRDVNALALQPDGKIIVGGSFTNYNGRANACNKIVRLNTDGSIDASFRTGIGFRGEVFALLLQNDGKILVGGGLASYNGSPCSDLVRLNSDGTLDDGFENVNGIQGYVYCMAPLPNGKYMVGGSFFHHGANNVNRIARLNNNGTYDNTFTKEGFNGHVFSVLPLPNGKLLVGGNFNRFGKNYTCYNIARLNNDGTPDASFPVLKPAKEYAGNGFRRMLLQSDGKVIAAGGLYFYGDKAIGSIVRLMPDGNVDPAFEAATGFDTENRGAAEIFALLQSADGSLLVAGNFKRYNSVLRNNLALQDKNGKLLPAYNVSTKAK